VDEVPPDRPRTKLTEFLETGSAHFPKERGGRPTKNWSGKPGLLTGFFNWKAVADLPGHILAGQNSRSLEAGLKYECTQDPRRR